MDHTGSKSIPNKRSRVFEPQISIRSVQIILFLLPPRHIPHPRDGKRQPLLPPRTTPRAHRNAPFPRQRHKGRDSVLSCPAPGFRTSTYWGVAGYFREGNESRSKLCVGQKCAGIYWPEQKSLVSTSARKPGMSTIARVIPFPRTHFPSFAASHTQFVTERV